MNVLSRRGECPDAISVLAADSRRVVVGGCFVALVGTNSDGHDYIDKAIESGAALIVYQRELAQYADGVAYLQVAGRAISPVTRVVS